MKPGHNNPNSKERTVPLTAPTANSTAKTLDHRRARARQTASPVAMDRRSAISISNGNPIPIAAKTMWKASVKAI